MTQQLPDQPPASPVNLAPQPVIPQMPPTQSRRGFGLTGVLLVVLGLATVGFGVFSVIAYDSSQKAKATLKTARDVSFKEGQAEQKKIDELAATVANESPYRSYIAPDFAGGFEIKFPKNWSATVHESQASSTQVIFRAQPNIVKYATNAQRPDNMALSVSLVKQAASAAQRGYEDRVKAGKLKSESVTVSGITGKLYTGKIDDKTTGQVATIGVRDKTIIFETNNEQFKAEYAQVLAQARIIP